MLNNVVLVGRITADPELKEVGKEGHVVNFTIAVGRPYKNENGEYWVSLNVENKDSMTSFNVGEEVVVYYDGNIKEIILSSSIEIEHQINNVYAITLKTPANRAENDKS